MIQNLYRDIFRQTLFLFPLVEYFGVVVSEVYKFTADFYFRYCWVVPGNKLKSESQGFFLQCGNSNFFYIAILLIFGVELTFISPFAVPAPLFASIDLKLIPIIGMLPPQIYIIIKPIFI